MGAVYSNTGILPGAVHNIHSADINQSTLLKLPADIPIVWTLHDFWPLRAVAFSWSEREDSRLNRHEIGPWSRKTLLQKRDIFFSSRRNVTLVAPSLYVQRVARHYSARHHIPCKFIPHVVNRTFFLPQDRTAARIHWNLDPGKLWIGVGSTWNNSRKGMDVLWRALSLIDCRSVGLLIWGHESNPQHPIRDLVVRSVGHVEDVEKLASLYASVDVFVCPTKADTGPLTVIESMAVGTPPLASKVGGIPERVTHEHNGLLFPSQDHESLAMIIAECVKKPSRLHELGSNARELAQQNFNPDHHVDLHCELYQQIIRKATF